MGSHAKDGKWVKEEFEVSLKAGSSGYVKRLQPQLDSMPVSSHISSVGLAW